LSHTKFKICIGGCKKPTHLWASQSLFPSVWGFNNFTISVKSWSIEVKNQLFWAVALSLSFDNQHLEHFLSQTHDSSKHVSWHLMRNAMRNANYRFRTGGWEIIMVFENLTKPQMMSSWTWNRSIGWNGCLKFNFDSLSRSKYGWTPRDVNLWFVTWTFDLFRLIQVKVRCALRFFFTI